MQIYDTGVSTGLAGANDRQFIIAGTLAALSSTKDSTESEAQACEVSTVRSECRARIFEIWGKSRKICDRLCMSIARLAVRLGGM